MYRINCKYAELLLAPANAICGDQVETTDGVKCRLEYQSTYNNDDGAFDERLDDICNEQYGCPFQTIKSIWISRLGSVSTYWHLVKMVKLEA